MCKWHIVIWVIDYIDPENDLPFHHEYYLFYRHAKKRFKRLINDESSSLPGVKYALGGEPLQIFGS